MPHPLQPYYVVPLLVEQSTWGGDYIATFKNLQHEAITGHKLGQSFELMGASRLLPQLGDHPSFGIAYNAKVTEPTWIGAENSVTLSELAADQRTQVFGTKLEGEFSTLIKFTQAQNNSYQVHVKPGTTLGHWQAKPESWYYFEKGKATLGIQADTELTEYHQRCTEIDNHAQQLSAQIKAGQLTVDQAREHLTQFIDQNHPRNYVNTVWIEAGQVVDLSQGGIHHSWEKDAMLPAGNIVYEVQVDVLDENCTLRSFDQGNIKDDGTVRPLSIDDYFQALDSFAESNQVDQYLRQPAARQISEGEVLELFTTPHYTSYQLTLTAAYRGELTSTNDSFHHVFAREGSGKVVTSTGEWTLAKGQSLFIPAATGEYQLIPDGNLQVITTTL